MTFKKLYVLSNSRFSNSMNSCRRIFCIIHIISQFLYSSPPLFSNSINILLVILLDVPYWIFILSIHIFTHAFNYRWKLSLSSIGCQAWGRKAIRKFSDYWHWLLHVDNELGVTRFPRLHLDQHWAYLIIIGTLKWLLFEVNIWIRVHMAKNEYDKRIWNMCLHILWSCYHCS